MSEKTNNEYLGKSHPLYKWMKEFSLTAEQVGAAIGMSGSCIRNVYRTGNALEPTIRKLHKFSTIPEEVLRYPEKYLDFDVSTCKPNINICEKCNQLISI